MRKLLPAAVLTVLSCGGPLEGEETDEFWEEEAALTLTGLPESLPVGTSVTATGQVTLRSLPSIKGSLLATLSKGARAVTVEQTRPTNNYYKVKYGTQVGYASRAAFQLSSATTPPSTSAPPLSGPAIGIGALVGPQELTFYWSALESNSPGAPTVPLYTATGCSKIATVSAAYFAQLKIEGSGKLNDGRGLGYYGVCTCPTTPCFTVLPTTAPWGLGASSNPLQPFRSIAIDRARLNLKAWYYAKELDGLTMPGPPPTGGYVHDGCVRADDTGSGIVGAHIDFMAGTKEWANALLPKLGYKLTLYGGGTRCK